MYRMRLRTVTLYLTSLVVTRNVLGLSFRNGSHAHASLQTRDAFSKPLWPAASWDNVMKELNAIAPVTSKINSIPVPAECANYKDYFAKTAVCKGVGMKAYQVTYADCPKTFTFCQCDGMKQSIRSVVDEMSRFPPRFREYIRLVYSRGGEGVCYASGDQLVMWDEVKADTFFHEGGHIVDFQTQNPSGKPGWSNAIRADTCVTNDYANTSPVEAYAEIMRLYSSTVLTSARQDIACMANQLKYISTNFRTAPDVARAKNCDEDAVEKPTPSHASPADDYSVVSSSSITNIATFDPATRTDRPSGNPEGRRPSFDSHSSDPFVSAVDKSRFSFGSDSLASFSSARSNTQFYDSSATMPLSGPSHSSANSTLDEMFPTSAGQHVCSDPIQRSLLLSLFLFMTLMCR